MFACGAPRTVDCVSVRAVAASLCMRKVVQEFSENNLNLAFRCGIATGTVVGGILG